MAIELDLQTATGFRPVPSLAEFEAWVAAALTDQADYVLTIRLVDVPESRSLNSDYRDKDYPTNVLSFPAELPAEVNIPLLGDIVICAPLVDSEAAEQGKRPGDHWAHLTVHGVLHLLGLDHQESDEARQMEQREVTILASLGIANPYD